MMGTKMGTPEDLGAVPAGDPCGICWGLGKPFGGGDTPESIEVTFEGIEKGPGWIPGNGEPIDGTFTLDQLAASPCEFTDIPAPPFGIFVNFLNGITQVGGVSDTGFPSFFRSTNVSCSTVFANQLVNRFINGSAVIRIPEVS